MPNTTPHPGVIYYSIDKEFKEWRISWYPGYPRFAIEKFTTLSEVKGRHEQGAVLGWQDWSTVNHDGIGDDHNAAYKFAQKLFTRCVNDEIMFTRCVNDEIKSEH